MDVRAGTQSRNLKAGKATGKSCLLVCSSRLTQPTSPLLPPTHPPNPYEQKKIYLTYTSISMFIIKRCQDNNSNSSTWREELALKLLTGLFPKMVQSVILQNPLSKSRNTQHGLGASPTNHNLRKCHTTSFYSWIVSIDVPPTYFKYLSSVKFT